MSIASFLQELERLTRKEFINHNLVLVGGCFDILHYGHLYFLKEAKKLGAVLAVLLESDEFIVKKKNRQPIHNQKERQEILENLKCVDWVIPLPLLEDSQDYSEIIKIIKPKVIAVTENDPQLINKTNQARSVGATIKIIPQLKSFSTSKIIQT